jgi:hypothetical protein
MLSNLLLSLVDVVSHTVKVGGCSGLLDGVGEVTHPLDVPLNIALIGYDAI